MAGGHDGHCGEGLIIIHPLPDSEAGADPQKLDGQLRVVGADGHLHPVLREDGRVGQTGVDQFRFAAGTDQRPADGAGLLFPQDVRGQVPLGAVDKDRGQAKFLGKTQGCEDIVSPVGVDVSLDLPCQQRKKGLALGVKIR